MPILTSRAPTVQAYPACGVSISSKGDYGYPDVSQYFSNDSSYRANSSSHWLENGSCDPERDGPPKSRIAAFGSRVSKHLKKSLSWVSLIASFLVILTIYYGEQGNWTMRPFLETTADAVSTAFNSAKSHLTRFQDEIKEVQYSKDELLVSIANLEEQVNVLEEEMSNSRNDIASLTARDLAWKEHVEVLENSVQRESKRSATELFGPGPRQVKFTVVLPNHDTKFFIVETAPLDLMPHAVHFFLQQVVRGLWNNAWFFVNNGHVLLAGPQAYEDAEVPTDEHDTERAAALDEFYEAYLKSLAFPEYSEEFPHRKWTLGFTGRPAGPAFYINKEDNTEIHGPGGQDHYELAHYADPCFAKVVYGFDVLEEIYKEPTYGEEHEWAEEFEEPIPILRAEIMDTFIHTDPSLHQSSDEEIQH